MPLKVLHLSTYDTNGGAARAAYALHQSMLKENIDSEMWVGKRTSPELAVRQVGQVRMRATSFLDRQLWRTQHSPRQTWRSPARFGALTARAINQSHADIVNLHWVTDGFLSVESIGQIKKPIVWSMYDMWPFTGTEHYSPMTAGKRWVNGYSTSNRPPDESGMDLDMWTFRRKVSAWHRLKPNTTLVPPSHWLEEETRSSFLFHDWDIQRTSHVVGAAFSQPLSQEVARSRLGLDFGSHAILFVASGGVNDPRKGGDVLKEALSSEAYTRSDSTLILVGPRPSTKIQQEWERSVNANIVWLGPVTTDDELLHLYCAADLLVAPSRLDNLPLTVMEALTCGCPVVAFNVGGISNLVLAEVTGVLVELGDTHGLAVAIAQGFSPDFRKTVRKSSTSMWGQRQVVAQYLEHYEYRLKKHAVRDG